MNTETDPHTTASSVVVTHPTTFDTLHVVLPSHAAHTDDPQDPDTYSFSYGLRNFPVDWPQAIFLVLSPVLGLLGALCIPCSRPTFLWALFYYFVSGTGITAGYHRLWAHKAYHAKWPYRLWMALAGVAAVEGSIRWWARHHRAHHRFTDTNQDPYSAHKGLFWSHFGWMLFKKHNAALKKVDISDLDRDPIVMWQHRLYLPLALLMAFVFPTLVAHFGWGDAWGGLVYAGLLRLVGVHHATFCVNSLAHWIGDRPFDDQRTPRDHFITALVTLGEGYHNFHHEFPNDYRNAIKFYQYDPTKWLIKAASLFGLVFHLKKAPVDVIEKGQINMIQKNLDRWRNQLYWGKPDQDLPVWDESQFKEELLLNPFLIVLHTYVHDVSLFIQDHPGGMMILKRFLGKDATQAFEGKVYKHSTAARHMTATLRIAKLQPRIDSDADYSVPCPPSTSLHLT